MRLLTWNTHRCFGSDGLYRPERILSVLQAARADVILLQEVDSSLHAPDGRNQLDYFAGSLGLDAVMGPTLHRDYGAYGNAILTRHEILSCEEYDLSYRRFEPRGALAIEMRAPDGGVLRIINTHLGLKYWERAFQIDRLLADMVWTGTEKVVVGGDFNEWFPWTINNLRLERSFHYATKRIATFPSKWARFALDRVFLTGSVGVMEAAILRDEMSRSASDHLPLVVDLKFSN